MNKKIIFISLLFLIGSCNNKTYKLKSYLAFISQNSGMSNFTYNLPEKFKKDEDLNGEFVFKDKTNKIYEKGVFNKGNKTGQWIYKGLDSTISIFWIPYSNNNFKISLPKDWYSIEQPNFFWTGVYPNNSINKNNKFFIIIKSLKLPNVTLSDFVNNNRDVSLQQNFNSHAFYEITIDAKKYFYSIYYKTEKNENIMILDIIGELDNNFYELTYSSLDENFSFKSLVFFDIIRNTIIGKNRFFPYLVYDFKITRSI